ncbi:INTEGRAL MEMBRANE PROTEIN (Rhomboid family) [Salipiger mucosus DSM 16094]|uniref:INTEGRAL MEMBRANE PROTEIN (Rhomboid family) n=2 Tax=Salipiger mucosus TaxID=263378 RepID=S9QA30_9RHOB|nr:INTEGRAL MEMBRANE PROTEIN (Rhomboid family) [Salipiger mucosus DSM 16094]
MSGKRDEPARRSGFRAAIAGTASDMTTTLAYSGRPTLAMYLLPLGLLKNVYAGTTSLFSTAGNLVKALPLLWLGALSAQQ